MSNNLYNRRHLNESQRALAAAKIANMASGTRTDLKPSANLREVISQDRAAAMLNVGKRSVQVAKEIIRKSPDSVPENLFKKTLKYPTGKKMPRENQGRAEG